MTLALLLMEELRQLLAVVVEHEQANPRRQIAVAAVLVDRGDQLGQRHVAAARDLLQRNPERIFEADTGLVTGDHDGAFDHWRFHRSSPVSTRCWSSARRTLASRAASSLRSVLLRPWSRRLVAARCPSCWRLASLRALRNLTTSPIVTRPPLSNVTGKMMVRVPATC